MTSPYVVGNQAQENTSAVPTPSPEYQELNARYVALYNDINMIKARANRQMAPGQIFLIGGGVVLGVATISIFSNYVWKKAFPGMPEDSRNVRAI